MKLTKEQIEEYRGQICDDEIWNAEGLADLNQLCDLALSALSIESVRSEARHAALEEAAKTCEITYAGCRHYHAITPAVLLEAAAAIRALSKQDIHSTELRK